MRDVDRWVDGVGAYPGARGGVRRGGRGVVERGPEWERDVHDFTERELHDQPERLAGDVYIADAHGYTDYGDRLRVFRHGESQQCRRVVVRVARL